MIGLQCFVWRCTSYKITQCHLRKASRLAGWLTLGRTLFSLVQFASKFFCRMLSNMYRRRAVCIAPSGDEAGMLLKSSSLPRKHNWNAYERYTCVQSIATCLPYGHPRIYVIIAKFIPNVIWEAFFEYITDIVSPVIHTLGTLYFKSTRSSICNSYSSFL